MRTPAVTIALLLFMLCGAGCSDDPATAPDGAGPLAPNGSANGNGDLSGQNGQDANAMPGVTDGTGTMQGGLGAAAEPGAGAGAAGNAADMPMSGSGDGAAASDGSADGADGAGGDGDSGGDDGGQDAAPTPGPFPSVSDFSAAGPYTGTTMVNVGPNNNYTVYLPMEPAPDGARNPLVAWTSGGGTSHAFYTLLPHLASHGFIVVTSNSIPGIGGEAQLGQEIIAGLDWALEENGRSGSMLFERIDSEHVASAGYSMGSLATFTIANDPRLTTTVHISGGNMVAEQVNNLHAPAAFICGIPDPACTDLLSSTCDIAGANCALDFEGAQTPVFYATFEAGHLGILTSPFMERINGMTTAWLRHYLMGDTTIASKFRGDDCEYCSSPDWTVKQKNWE